MRPQAPHTFEQIISKPRLDSYRGYFHANVDEAIGLYVWNGEIASCLATLLSYFEIALRNKIHRAMSEFYSSGASTSMNWYDTIRSQLKPDTRSKIDKVRFTRGPGGIQVPRNPAPNPDELVSRVTFGFWPAILGTVDKRYADQLLSKIFPHHVLSATPVAWKVKADKQKALAFIYELNELRNRIAHHEPLWKFPAVKDTSVNPALVIVPESTTQADTLVRFQRLLGLFESGVGAMSNDLLVDLQQSSWRKRLDFLLSDRGIKRYRTLRHVPKNAITPTVMRQQFGVIVKGNQPIRIARDGSAGIFIPD